MEIVDTMIRRKISVICLQETKWVGEKAREIENSGFKLWYTGKEKHKNGVGIIVDKDLKDSVVDVKRVGDRIIKIKMVLGQEIINVISAYAPQIGLAENLKRQFLEDMDGIIQGISGAEKIFIGADLNGHIGKDNKGYERIHGGHGYGDKNEVGDMILDFAMSYDLITMNTCFKKREEHLITFKSGQNKSQIDFFLTRRVDRLSCKDCKVIPGESLTTQHRVLVLDICIKKWKRKANINHGKKIRWWNLKGEI